MGLGSLLGLTPDLTQKLARMFIQPLKLDGAPDEAPDGLGTKGLPFWPESISDTKGAIWNETQVPGGSHPIYQFVAGTARTISFSLVLSHETQEVDPLVETEDVYNIDIKGAIAWLRGMVYPLYEDDVAEPPPVLLLVFPGLALGGADGADSVLTIMTQCDLDYQLCFNDGTPRLAVVNVSFNEVVQEPGSGEVFFFGRDFFHETASRFFLDPKPQ